MFHCIILRWAVIRGICLSRFSERLPNSPLREKMKYCRCSLVLFALLLTGCAPNAVTYYRPMIDGGTVLKRHCVPTESIVEFNLPGANGHLHVRAWAENGKYVNQIALFFSGKAWREIHFTSAAFQIRNLEENTISSASSIVAYKADAITNLTPEPYTAPPEKPGLARFQVQVNSDHPLPKRFELQSPTIVIDGQEILFPAIRFEQKQWMGISPLNC